MKKTVIFAFRGDPVCFIHVLLNALDMNARGYDAKIVVEGEATKLIPEISRQGNPLFSLYMKTKDLQLIAAVCKACSSKMGVLEEVRKEGLPIADEMSGHPSLARFLDDGYDIITF
jgi:hypothetical protein